MTIILITGAAGFIGFHTAKHLLNNGFTIIGIDNLNNYYNPHLKQSRLSKLKKYDKFNFINGDLRDKQTFDSLEHIRSSINYIIHLAAQPGVRPSIASPIEYMENNVNTYINVLEYSRTIPTLQKIIYASSSSVYGNNTKTPFSIQDEVILPISPYAVTKLTGENLSYCYHQLYDLNITALRFFTVYGPWGRPDMAIYKFADNIALGEPIVINAPNIRRDFTYITDIVIGIFNALTSNKEGYQIYNLGNNKSERIEDVVNLIEESIGRKAIVYYNKKLPMGDVLETYADITESIKDLNFRPQTSIQEGIPKFIEWHKTYRA